jgi:triosephosphate isomerase (TIM)
MDMMKPLIAGNWKMNGRAVSIVELDAMISRADSDLLGKTDLMICPPATLLSRLADRALGTGIEIGGQDCHIEAGGAHTGDIAAEMLRDCGAVSVIVGHSERRTDHGETNEIVRAKAEAARRAGLLAIVCVGETAAERQSGDTLAVVGAQVLGSLPANMTGASLVVAYEPVWAIGTGLTPTIADVAEVHGFIRAKLVEIYGAEGKNVRILYGGSVKPSNAKELLAVADVNGALVGGASLKAVDFLAIADAYR